MRRRIVAMILATGIANWSGSAHAALFTSSATFNAPYTNSFYVTSNRFKPANGLNTGIAGNQYPNALAFDAGVTSASVTVDADADTGHLTAMGIAPFSVTPSSVGESISTSVKIVVADFPNPPVIQTISGVWQESISITGITGAPPSFTPAAMAGAMNPEPQFLPWYSFFQQGILTGGSSIFLTGTYQVIGPLSTKTVPINIELQPNPASSFASVAVKGSNSFGDGFTFAPLTVGMDYVPVNPVNPVIFEGDVDHLHFSVQMNSSSGVQVLFRNSPLPEPSSLAMAALGGCLVAGVRRRRG